MLKSILAKLSAAKLAAIVTAAVVVGAGSAAATGALPSSVQRPLSDALSHVGISIPKPSSSSGTSVAAKSSSKAGASSSSKSAASKGTKHRSGVATEALKLKGKEHDVLGLCMAYEAQHTSGHGSLSTGSMKELSSFASSNKTTVAGLCKEIAALRPSASKHSTHQGVSSQNAHAHDQKAPGSSSTPGSPASGFGQANAGAGQGAHSGPPSGVPGASHASRGSGQGSSQGSSNPGQSQIPSNQGSGGQGRGSIGGNVNAHGSSGGLAPGSGFGAGWSASARVHGRASASAS